MGLNNVLRKSVRFGAGITVFGEVDSCKQGIYMWLTADSQGFYTKK